MNELYDKANGLRPRFALSLDDTDKKESGYAIYISFLRCPSKYSARDARKLIQAVKLYDQLLAEQHSRPRWSAMQESASIPNAGVSSLLPHANVQPTIFLAA